ncbi:hypothetical protein LOTGIDRAFT_172056 [Lottia gigantea]|uniref:Uncharacterized protein n=1 Tax=Lottia gigantea TaxID=225164 RepID=V4AXX7_LOTGI|nr:hypothetical protein LOTGIDRAFT_172056 [Lottia gigantea]ESP02398.1 hypothetical protein LOTGIDRAFT_172056 [Lottia gigantea]
MDNWNNILKRNKEYIKATNKIKTQVENNRLQQLGLTSGVKTRRLMAVETYLNKVIRDEEESDDYPPITEQIDELEEEIAREKSGQGITFLSDNKEELLNRLRVILAAMKEGHRSHRQYNEVNCILKRLLEKGIIDKNDYKSVIKNVK